MLQVNQSPLITPKVSRKENRQHPYLIIIIISLKWLTIPTAFRYGKLNISLMLHFVEKQLMINLTFDIKMDIYLTRINSSKLQAILIINSFFLHYTQKLLLLIIRCMGCMYTFDCKVHTFLRRGGRALQF